METLLIAAVIFIFLWIAGTLENRKERRVKPKTSYKPPKVNDYYLVDEQFIRSHKQDYLKSKEWAILSKIVHSRDKICQVCGATSSLEVHHITYERFMYEKPADLVLLCRTHHQAVHDKYGYDYNDKFPIKDIK